MPLAEYRKKRHFKRTSEPRGSESTRAGARFVIQKHAASRLHYDFRLELDGVLKSWAVPKGPSLDPSVRALAVHVEDHPLEYASFEGTIPAGQYGGGTVMLWDEGAWQPEGDARRDYERGKLTFRLRGKRLRGRWVLVRMAGKAGEGGKNWLLRKLDDEMARPPGVDPVATETTSISTRRTMQEIAEGKRSHIATRRKPVSDELPKRQKKPKGARSTVDLRALDEIEGARPAPIAKTISPQLAQLVRDVPTGAGWIHELKLDGYRILAFVKAGRVRLVTRRGNDWTARFPAIRNAVEALGLRNAVVDGEVVVLTSEGTSDFQALQNSLRHGDSSKMAYFLFDLLHLDGYDLRNAALTDRKAILAQLLTRAGRSSVVRYSDHIQGDGEDVLKHACRHALEGIVAKRADSRYIGRRTSDWVKVKCSKRQEFVIGGWTEPAGQRSGLGALLVGYNRGSDFVYAGRVGTGFTAQSLHDVHTALRKLERRTPPFVLLTSLARRGVVHWVEPQLVCEIEFGAWTGDGLLRHAVFHGLREDKSARDVTIEIAIGAARKGKQASHEKNSRALAARGETQVGGVRITHPGRVLFPESDLTKETLARYYEAVAVWMLPHVTGRPLSVVRCPEGREKACFFQRHWNRTTLAPIRGIEVDEKDGRELYLGIDDERGLITLIQMGVLEIHPWSSREDRLDRPDRLIIDLDPGPAVGWPDLVHAARDVKKRLDAVNLVSFVRTTGGKGLHLILPIVRQHDWEEMKAFARAIADGLSRSEPARFIATASKAKREGKIYVDYLRNERGATAIAPYSTRARAGAPVATPIRWNELSAGLVPSGFNTESIPKRLAKLQSDPWEGFLEVKQRVTRSIQRAVRAW